MAWTPETIAGAAGGAVTVIGGIVAAIVGWRRAAAAEKRDDYASLFDRQQIAIDALQRQIDRQNERYTLAIQDLRREHTACREENAALKARVAELERDIAELKNGR